MTMGKLSDRRRSKYSTVKLMILLVLMNVLISTVTSHSSIGKCCPLGQLLSVSENYTCVYTEDRSRQLYPLKNRERPDDILACAESQNLTITSLDDIENEISNATTACVDLLWDEKVEKSIPIVYHCLEDEENNNETLTTTGSLPAPRIATLRICCGPNTVYDVKQHECVPVKEENEIGDFLKIFNNKIDFVTIVRGRPKCEHAIVDYTVNITKDLRVFDNGKFEIILSSKDESFAILTSEENSCLDPGTGATDQMVVRRCSGSRFCKNHPCIRKCCLENQSFIDERCGTLPADLPPISFAETLLNTSITRGGAAGNDVLNNLDYGVLFGGLCTFGMYSMDSDEQWYVTSKGHMYAPRYGLFSNNDHCVDFYYDNLTNDVQITAFPCFDETRALEESPIRYVVNAAMEFTSCAFLILTLLVYICLPTLQNLHGKTIMSHVTSLGMAYFCLGIIATGTPVTREGSSAENDIFCTILGYTALYFWISAFSWLNVMCFDIWWTFGGRDGPGVSSSRGRAYRKRFFMYSIYGWGFALLVVGLGSMVDSTEFLPNDLRPNIGMDGCWFLTSTYSFGEMVFFVAPVTLQLIANMTFFILTVRYCNKVKAEIARLMATPADPRSKRLQAVRTKLIMNGRLSAVMGITWGFEIISRLLNQYAPHMPRRVEAFYVFDAINSLQGPAIFFLFVMKSKVYHALRKRFGREKQKVPPGQGGLQDPYKMRNSASTSTIMSTFAISASP